MKIGAFDVIRSLITWFLVGIITLFWFQAVLLLFIISPFVDRNFNHVFPVASYWAKTILFFCPFMRVHLEGGDHLRRRETYVLIANHQSLADILVVLHLNHPFKFIAKRELFWIPIFGWALYMAGFIPLVRGDRRSGQEALKRARHYLDRGASILFFPEGTRSLDGEIHSFKIGAFKLACDAGVPVVPIVIDGTKDLIAKGTATIGRGVEVVAKVGLPRAANQSDDASIEAFSEEVRMEMISTLKEMRSRRKLEQVA